MDLTQLITQFYEGSLEHSKLQSILASQCKDLDQLRDNMKTRANSAFKAKNYSEAANLFTSCILATDPKNKTDLAKLYANRSCCYLKLNKIRAALSDSIIAVTLDKSYYKIWLRVADAYEAFGDFASAEIAIDRALKQVPNDEFRRIIRQRKKQIGDKHWHAKILKRYKTDYSKFEFDAVENGETAPSTGANTVRSSTTDDGNFLIEFAQGLSPDERKYIEAAVLQKSPAGGVSTPEFSVCAEFAPADAETIGNNLQAAMLFITQLTFACSQRAIIDRMFHINNSSVAAPYFKGIDELIASLTPASSSSGTNSLSAQPSQPRLKVCLIGCNSIITALHLLHMNIELSIVVDESASLIEIALLKDIIGNRELQVTWLNVGKQTTAAIERREENDENISQQARQIINESLYNIDVEEIQQLIEKSHFDLTVIDIAYLEVFLTNPLHQPALLQHIPRSNNYFPSRIDVVCSLASLDLSKFLLVKEPWSLCMQPYNAKIYEEVANSDTMKLLSFNIAHLSSLLKPDVVKSPLVADGLYPIKDVHLKSDAEQFTPNAVLLGLQLYDTHKLIYDSNLSRRASPDMNSFGIYKFLIRRTQQRIESTNESILTFKVSNQTFVEVNYETPTAVYSSRYIEGSKAMPNIFATITACHDEVYEQHFDRALKSCAPIVFDKLKPGTKNKVNILMLDCRSYADVKTVIRNFIRVPRYLSSKFASTEYEIHCCSTNSLAEVRQELNRRRLELLEDCAEQTEVPGAAQWISGASQMQVDMNKPNLLNDEHWLMNCVKYHRTYIYQIAPASEQIRNSYYYNLACKELFRSPEPIDASVFQLELQDPVDLCSLGGFYYLENEFDPFQTDLLQQALYIRYGFGGQNRPIICPGKLTVYALLYSYKNYEFISELVQYTKRVNSFEQYRFLKLVDQKPKVLLSVDLNNLTFNEYNQLMSKVHYLSWNFETEQTICGVLCYAEYQYGFGDEAVGISHAPKFVELDERTIRFRVPQQIFLPLPTQTTNSVDLNFTISNKHMLTVHTANFTASEPVFNRFSQVLDRITELINKYDSVYFNAAINRIPIIRTFQRALVCLTEKGLPRGIDVAIFDQVFMYLHSLTV